MASLDWACSTESHHTKRPRLAINSVTKTQNSTPDSQNTSPERIDGSNTSGGSWYMSKNEANRDTMDSGYSDVATPTASCDNSQESFNCNSNNLESNEKNDSGMSQQSNGSNTASTALEPQDTDENDDGDALSDISNITDMSESDWKSTDMSGPFSWVQQHMMKGTNPRDLLKEMVDESTVIPDKLDQLTLWKIILNMISEPPRRQKLPDINTIQDVVDLIKKSQNILVLTGAGVSVSCGIPDFRSRDGIYARLAVDFPDLPDPQSMFDIHYFRKDPRPFFKFAKEIYPGQFQPSPCHKFIQCLEKHNKLLRNYTQNIDTLEQVVGIQRVVQCHGSFATASCTKCKNKVSAESIKKDIFEQKIPLCSSCNNTNSSPKLPWEAPSVLGSTNGPTIPVTSEAPGIMKPDIVFFGEDLGSEFHTSVAKDKDKVDMLIMIGSSLKVRPVALIPSSISSSVPQVLINRESLSHVNADVELLGDCDGIINQLCHMLGKGWEESLQGKSMNQADELLPKPQSQDSPDEKESSKSEEENSSSLLKDSVDEEDMGPTWSPKPRVSLSTRLPDGKYFFQEPSRYIFPGAEVFSSDSESEDDDDDDEAQEAGIPSSSSPSTQPSTSTG